MTAASSRGRVIFPLAPGFAVGAVAGGLWLGGAFALGRHDLVLAVPTLMAFAAVYVALNPLRGRALLVHAAATLVITASLASLFGWRGGTTQSALFIGAAALALALALAWRAHWLTARKSRLAWWSVLIATAILWWGGSHILLARAYLPTVAMQSGRTMVVTGLPLVRWSATGDALGLREDAALAALRAMIARPIVLVDALAQSTLTSRDRLLLAHPPALPPEALVEIDRFVRAGGRAVVLADGLSGWPPPHPFGHARNPPVTSLLTPLLDHWGVSLAAPVPNSAAAEAVTVQHADHRLALHSAGHFDRLPPGCQAGAAITPGQPMVATCRIGRGTVVLLADADLLYAPLWRSDPGWARHLRPSDNIEWVAGQLDGPQRSARGLHPTWR